MRLGLLAFISLAVPATAGDFSLSSPIDCDLNGPCYIQQYVDHDTSDGASDFMCSGLSYDKHKGTDFALPGYDMITEGVDVLASATGVVAGIRDGMDDARYSPSRAAAIEGRECGNGLVLRHQDGWETQYCHLRKGSLTVKSGQVVKAGEIIGKVGMSGRAEFPHVHLSVRKNGAVVDPFDPDGKITCGAPETETLWSEVPPYRAGGIVSIGTASAVPEFIAIRENSVTPPDATSDALVIYAFLFGTQKGDIIRMTLHGPGGTVVERDTLLKRAQAQSFRAIGKKRRGVRWPAGVYKGKATLLRRGNKIDSQSLTLTLR
ncbi:M23 family metallopeptidase [Sulfitobacter sp. F26169L]|uniref:M23 family metallopeptidase n=1 Tax=Sulfitobacter sp. F26169L TaxID=2996015 RepID=UPI002260BCCA|nr:M23 family metallopeptidase [Sulfitobacter sp. F26169L]MCX7566958.1 M23 family metallopeptidase [Sulfitobacter sp. F26169L]